MIIFDLAKRFPGFGEQLQTLIRDKQGASEAVEWMDGYLAALRDTNLIADNEHAACLAQMAMSIGRKASVH